LDKGSLFAAGRAVAGSDCGGVLEAVAARAEFGIAAEESGPFVAASAPDEEFVPRPAVESVSAPDPVSSPRLVLSPSSSVSKPERKLAGNPPAAGLSAAREESILPAIAAGSAFPVPRFRPGPELEAPPTAGAPPGTISMLAARVMREDKADERPKQEGEGLEQCQEKGLIFPILATEMTVGWIFSQD
jgi:hypothetical protein